MSKKLNRIVYTVNKHHIDDIYAEMYISKAHHSEETTEGQIALTFTTIAYGRHHTLPLQVRRKPGQRFIFPTDELIKSIKDYIQFEFGDGDYKLIMNSLDMFIAKLEREWLVEATETELLEEILPTFESPTTEDSYVVIVLADKATDNHPVLDFNITSNKGVKIGFTADVNFPLYENNWERYNRMHSAIATQLGKAHPKNTSRRDGVKLDDYLNLVTFITNHVMKLYKL